VYGNGSNIRDWLHVSDHCEAIRCVLSQGLAGDTYNIGGDAERRNIDVVKGICTILDRLRPRHDGTPYETLIHFVKDRPGHDQRYAIDASKLQSTLGWKPAYDFESGLEETVNWYLSHPDWVARVLDGSYRLERLGV
jgi:dTDP-glucose 4,6-dehydratase